MSKRSRLVALSFVAAVGGAAASLTACQPTSHVSEPSQLGSARSAADLEALADQPGPVVVETVVGADWEVPRSGLINLDSPKAKAAHLKDGMEPIVIQFHALHHPTFGLFIVDTGVEKALRDDPSHAALSGFAANYMGVEKIKVRHDTAGWLATQKEPLKGVFLTHLHLDHIAGMRDVPSGALVYTGPGEGTDTGFMNAFVRGPTDAALEGKGALHEWRFAAGTAHGGQGSSTETLGDVVDVFGDGSVWAISVPGHTAGSTAYLARTPNGSVLMTGDACHTAWGWENGVEPGTYSEDRARSAVSLARLEAFVARHPHVDVRPGHQAMPSAAAPPKS